MAEQTIDNGSDETVQWTLTDHLNTVRDVAKYDPDDDMTTVVNHLIYDSFGRVTSEGNPAVDSLFLFTARPFDSDTQLQNNLNRWYDSAVGRWLSEDPIGFAAGDGNLYRYAQNGVVQSFDPVGLSEPWRPEDAFDALMLGVITPEEANYFYNRSRDELQHYIKWRLENPHVPSIVLDKKAVRISLRRGDGCCNTEAVDKIISRANEMLAQPSCVDWFRRHGLRDEIVWTVNCHSWGKLMCHFVPAWTYPGLAIGLCENWLYITSEIEFASLLIHELAHHFCPLLVGREECAIIAQDACA